MTAYFAFGLPTPFTHWCEHVLAALLTASGASVETVWANTLEELALVAMRAQSPNLVVQVRTPTPPMREALERTARRFLVVLDTPLAACGLLDDRGPGRLAAATKAITSGCAAMVRMAAMPGALCLHSLANAEDPMATALAIGEWFGLGVDAATTARIVEQAGPTAPSPSTEEQAMSTFAPAERAMIAGAIRGYVDWFGGKGIGPLTFTPELFIEGDPPHPPASRTIELAGRVRLLVMGPHIALPPGTWTVTLSMAFSKEAAGTNYSIDIGAGTTGQILAHMTMSPAGAGVFECSTVFSVTDDTDQPVWLRVINERAAIDGQIAVGQAIMTPLSSARREIPDHIAAALSL